MRRWMKTMIVAASAAMMLCGCSEKHASLETAVPTVAETETSAKSDGADDDSGVKAPAQADEAHLEELLALITSKQRPSGSEGETKTAEAIKDYFASLGYETTLQQFVQRGSVEGQADVAGTNVIAVKPAKTGDNQSDILIISAHHDAKPGIQGAVDDASGVAVMMEAARLVAGLDTGIEVRFLSFSGEEDGRIGSRYYVEQMTDAERSRIIGDLQLDEIGYINSDYMVLDTVDGEPTLVGNLLSEKAEQTRNMGRKIPYGMNTLSDHNSFASHSMPAVMLCQDAFTYENHSTQDTVQILDMGKLSQTAQLVADVTADIMGMSGVSFRQAAYEVTPLRIGFAVGKETQLYFGQDRNFVENMMGTTGTLDRKETNEYGDSVEYYRHLIRWFDMDTAIPTLLEYRNGFLELIEIEMQEATGKTMEETKALITDALGVPDSSDSEFGKEYDWGDETYHKFYSLIPGEDDAWQLLLMDYSAGKNLENTYDLSMGLETQAGKKDTDKKFLELLEKIIYPQDLPLIQFSVYSDGMGNSTGFTGGVDVEDNTQMQYALDWADAFDDQGEWRDYQKTIKTAVHEYGHVLSLNAGQVDITKQDDSLPKMMYETETYTEDAYLRAYYEEFWKGQDVKTGLDLYSENPTAYVSKYGATNITEDFAESFMLFILSGKPEDDSLASEKIRFFYEYEDMMARRVYIRENLSLTEDGAPASQRPEPAEKNVMIALDGNPTTGYEWTYEMEPADVAEEVNRYFHQENAQQELVGAGGTELFEFAGQKEGTAVLTFTYARSWEPEKPDNQKKIFELTVDAEGTVTVQEQ